MRLNNWLTLLVTLALSICVGFGAAAASDWELGDKEDGITSYKKSEPGSPVTAFKGEAVIDAPLAKVAWVIRDNDHRTEWVDRLQSSRVLETIATGSKIIYQHFGLPWPIADRDYVYEAKLAWQGETLQFDLKSTTNSKSPETVGVRANLIRCTYRLKPWGENRTHITVEVHTDPAGSLPAWLVNIIQRKWPIKTLSGIRKMVKKPYAKMSELPAKP
jgi:hypothetical protein